MGPVVVEDGVDDLADPDVALESVEQADEFLMPLALHVPPETLAGQNVRRGEQRGRAVALVIVRHGRAPTLLERQPWLGPVERLDLGLPVDAEHHCMGRRRDVELDNIMQRLGESGIGRELEAPPAMGRETGSLADLPHRRNSEPGCLGRRRRRLVGWPRAAA